MPRPSKTNPKPDKLSEAIAHIEALADAVDKLTDGYAAPWAIDYRARAEKAREFKAQTRGKVERSGYVSVK